MDVLKLNAMARGSEIQNFGFDSILWSWVTKLAE